MCLTFCIHNTVFPKGRNVTFMLLNITVTLLFACLEFFPIQLTFYNLKMKSVKKASSLQCSWSSAPASCLLPFCFVWNLKAKRGSRSSISDQEPQPSTAIREGALSSPRPDARPEATAVCLPVSSDELGLGTAFNLRMH